MNRGRVGWVGRTGCVGCVCVCACVCVCVCVCVRVRVYVCGTAKSKKKVKTKGGSEMNSHWFPACRTSYLCPIYTYIHTHTCSRLLAFARASTAALSCVFVASDASTGSSRFQYSLVERRRSRAGAMRIRSSGGSKGGAGEEGGGFDGEGGVSIVGGSKRMGGVGW